MAEKMKNVSWPHQDAKAVFRGKLTREAQIEKKNRWKVLSSFPEELIDAQYSMDNNVADTDMIIRNKRHTDILDDKVCNMLGFKYILVMDASTSSWLQYPQALQSNSVPLIVESDYTPLYLHALIPWYHYVPIKSNLTDLTETITYL